MVKKSFCIFLFAFSGLVFAQEAHYRFTAGYTIKEIDTLGVQKISIGEVFLDKSQKNLFFYQEFPVKKETKLRDTLLSTYQGDTLAGSIAIKGFYEMAIYNTILSSKMEDFGLKERGYTLDDVKEENDKVISKYTPRDSEIFGNVELVLNKDFELELVLVFSPDNVLLSKTYFTDYATVKGLLIPKKIYQVAYLSGKEVKKITSLKNVKIDEETRSNMYLD